MGFLAILTRAVAVAGKMATDIAANRPLPAAPPVTAAQAAAALRQFQAELPAIIAAIEAHPGDIRAADDFLEALDASGYTWAAEAETAVNAAPVALEAVAKWLPDILFALGAFQPVPIPLPGEGPRVGRG